jgi:uncharacterized protein
LAVELLRVVAVSTGDGKYAVTVDPAGTLPGRGAWLHPVPLCVTEAIRRRAFGRALRITGALDTTAVIGHVENVDASGTPADRQAAKNMSTP